MNGIVSICSIRPLFPLGLPEEGSVLVTERLFLRPLVVSDLEAVHETRQRPLVMSAMRRTPNANLDQARKELNDLVPPPDVDRQNMLYAMCLKQAGAGNAQCGELIGFGGVYRFRSDITGWPELGYMLHDAHWGKGYATEFVRGFLEIYAALPRPAVPVWLQVNRDTLQPEDLDASRAVNGQLVVEEKLTAIVADYNARSQGVMRKTGFTEITTYVEESDSSGSPVLMRVYQLHPGRVAVGKATGEQSGCE